jgi:hypothetical protein
VVLHPSAPHIPKSETSSALAAAEEILDSRGSARREYRNSLVFLAADHRRLPELERGVAEALAWATVEQEAGEDGLNLDPNQTRQARTKAADAARTATLRLAETYQWLLVPEQPDAKGPIGWDEVKADGADGLAVRAGRKLVDKAELYEQFNPALIRMALDGPLEALWADGHVDVARLWDTFNRYLYLQRVTSLATLMSAVGDGPASVTWQADGFALADAHDGVRYRGLITGERAAAVTSSTLLVRPDVAIAQRSAESAPERDDQGDPGHSDEGAVSAAGSVPTRTAPTHFHAITELDPQRLVRDFGNVAQEVVAHLTTLDGASVTIRVEIEAERPDGFEDGTIRTVTENAATLKFESHGFES